MLQDGNTPPAYRSVRLSGEPMLAVVVLSEGEPERLTMLLRTLAVECGRRRIQLAVASRRALTDPHRWAKAFPGVRFVSGESLSERELRARGLAAADDGDIVVFAEEAEVASVGWLDARLSGWPGVGRRGRGRSRRRGPSLTRRTGSAAPIANQNNGLV